MPLKRGQFSPKSPQQAPHSSPVRVSVVILTSDSLSASVIFNIVIIRSRYNGCWLYKNVDYIIIIGNYALLAFISNSQWWSVWKFLIANIYRQMSKLQCDRSTYLFAPHTKDTFLLA